MALRTLRHASAAALACFSAWTLVVAPVLPAAAAINAPVFPSMLPQFPGPCGTSGPDSATFNCNTLLSTANAWAPQTTVSATAAAKTVLQTLRSGALESGLSRGTLRIDAANAPGNEHGGEVSGYIQQGVGSGLMLSVLNGGVSTDVINCVTGRSCQALIAIPSASADTTLDTTANSQNRLSRVASAAALASWTNYAFPAERDDLQGYKYTDTGASCTVGVPAAVTNAVGASTSTSITVKSGTGISAGQLIEGVGVPLGTTVSSISGTTVTASAAVNTIDDQGLTFATAGVGDGGWQIQPAAGHCWRADISKGAPITMWGGIDDDSTDNQPAFAKAIVATVAAGSGQIIVPGSAVGRCYRLNSQVTNANPGIPVAIIGQLGRASCVDLNYASGDGFHWGFPTAGAVRATGGIADITFKFAVMHTAGAAVQFDQIDVTFADRITCLASGFQCVAADRNSTNIEINEIQARYEGQTGIALGCNTPGIAANVRIKGADFNYQHRAALELCGASGIGIHDFNSDFNFHSLWAHPSGGKQVQAVIADGSDYFDVSSDHNVLWDASQGLISENSWGNRTWVASSGYAFTVPATDQAITTAAFTQNTTAAGIYATDLPSGTGTGTTGTSTPGAANLVNNKFDVIVFNSGGSGIVLIGGANNAFSGTTTDNNAANATSSENPGMLVQSNTYHWSWSGTAGGASGLVSSPSNNHQSHGIYVGAGSGDYYTISGDLTGNVNGGLSDNGTGTHKLTSQILQ